MRSKKLLALGMASLMMLSTVTVAFGADETVAPATGSVSGTGDIVGYVDKDVFTVTLPTTTDVSFMLDPQELQLAVDSSFKVDGAQASAGYGADVLFTNADTAGTGYAKNSKDITVVNKSTFDVDVSVTAKVTGLKDESAGYDIKLVDPTAESFDWGTDTSIALLLTPSTNTLTGTTEGSATPVADDAKYLTNADAGVTVKQKVAAIADPSAAYEVATVSGGGYVYQLKSDVSTVAFNQIEFNLSGKVNTNAKADWSKFNDAASTNLKVDITYTVDKHVDGPQVTLTAGGLVTLTNLTATQNIIDINSFELVNVTTNATSPIPAGSFTWNGDTWSSDNGGSATLQFASAWNVWNDAQVKVSVKLTDGTTIESNTVTWAIQ